MSVCVLTDEIKLRIFEAVLRDSTPVPLDLLGPDPTYWYTYAYLDGNMCLCMHILNYLVILLETSLI